MVAPFLIALGIAVVAMTAFVTAANYHELPERIPTHFGFSPEPNAYGPKPTAWMLPIVQVAIVLISGFAANQKPVSVRELLPVLAIVDAVLLTLFAGQRMIIETAKNGPSWRSYRTFWFFFALTMLVVPVSVLFAK
jgi:uncharacterized membrane protein